SGVVRGWREIQSGAGDNFEYRGATAVKFLDEYRDADAAQTFAGAIRQTVTRPWTIVEVCGGQTHAIVKFGIGDLDGTASRSCPCAKKAPSKATALPSPTSSCACSKPVSKSTACATS